MAIVKHVASKSSSYGATMDYMEHEHDEHGRELLDEHGQAVERFYLCDTLNVESKDTYTIECAAANKFYNVNQKREDVKQHQYIISFSSDEVKRGNLSPEKVMEIGKEWANKNLQGHQAILYVHTDGHNQSGNLHVHININSVRIADAEKQAWMKEQKKHYKEGMKHTCTAPMRQSGRDSLNHILAEHNLDLTVQERSDKRISNREYYADMRGKEKHGTSFDTQKEEIRQCIADIAPQCMKNGKFDTQLYVEKMKSDYGIEVTESRGRFSYKHPDWQRKRPVSDRKLGDAYRKENLEHGFSEQKNRANSERNVGTDSARAERDKAIRERINGRGGRAESRESGTNRAKQDAEIDNRDAKIDQLKAEQAERRIAEIKRERERIAERERAVAERTREVERSR